MRLGKRIRFSFLSGTPWSLIRSLAPQRGTLALLSTDGRKGDKRAFPPTTDAVPG